MKREPRVLVELMAIDFPFENGRCALDRRGDVRAPTHRGDICGLASRRALGITSESPEYHRRARRIVRQRHLCEAAIGVGIDPDFGARIEQCAVEQIRASVVCWRRLRRREECCEPIAQKLISIPASRAAAAFAVIR